MGFQDRERVASQGHCPATITFTNLNPVHHRNATVLLESSGEKNGQAHEQATNPPTNEILMLTAVKCTQRQNKEIEQRQRVPF